ncbi:hypothetical protein BH10ACI1_BH10ACI1_18100 [soil metagenome]
MSKKYYKMSAAELVVFLDNFNTIAEANKNALGISDDKLRDLQAIKPDLQAKLNERQAKQEAAVAATSALNLVVKNANSTIGSLNTVFKSDKTIPASLIELLGLDADDDSLTSTIPVAPTDLVVEGRSNGINYLRWKSGGNKPRINYIVEGKIGDAPDYVFIKTTTKTRFEHKNQTPGVRVFYRVKAVHGDLESANSNVAVVYN